MRHPYYLLAIPMTSFLIVVGIGMWSLDQAPAQKKTDAKFQPYVHSISAKEEPPVARINRSLDALRHARAFHVDINRTETDQSFKGSIDYVRPFRLSAEMQFNQEKPLKTIIVGQTVYIQETESGAWQMSDQEDLRQFGEAFFKEMSNGPVTVAEYGVSADTEPEISNDTKEQCTEYAFQRSDPDESVRFCIDQADNIRFIRVREANASTQMTFSRLNDFFIIERPALPLLERKIRLEQISEP